MHLEQFPEFSEHWLDSAEYAEWESLSHIREAVLKELEMAREEKLIGNSLEAEVLLKTPAGEREILEKFCSELPSLFIVSKVILNDAQSDEIEVQVARIKSEKCQRCWNYSDFVGTSPEYPNFCRRCADVVQDIEL